MSTQTFDEMPKSKVATNQFDKLSNPKWCDTCQANFVQPPNTTCTSCLTAKLMNAGPISGNTTPDSDVEHRFLHDRISNLDASLTATQVALAIVTLAFALIIAFT